jgi:addiction module HigA family antidote
MLPKNRLPMHPGKLLGRILSEKEMTQAELAKRLGVSLQTVNTLINEKRGMTAEMAVRLAKVFGTSAQLWMSLQTNHDLWLAQNALRAHG